MNDSTKCSQCGSPMCVVEDKMVCANDDCCYQYEITVFNGDVTCSRIDDERL